MGNRLYVGNLSFNSTEDSIRQCFAEFGDVSEVRLVLDRETGRSRGFAFVTMSGEDGARNAISQLNGTLLDGRPLRVNEAEERGRGGGGFGGGDRGGGRTGGHRGW